MSRNRLRGTGGKGCGRLAPDLRHRAESATCNVSRNRLRGALWQRSGCVAHISCHAADRATFLPRNRLCGATFAPRSRFVDMPRHAADSPTLRMSPIRLPGANPAPSVQSGFTQCHAADFLTFRLSPIRLHGASLVVCRFAQPKRDGGFSIAGTSRPRNRGGFGVRFANALEIVRKLELMRFLPTKPTRQDILHNPQALKAGRSSWEPCGFPTIWNLSNWGETGFAQNTTYSQIRSGVSK